MSDAVYSSSKISCLRTGSHGEVLEVALADSSAGCYCRGQYGLDTVLFLLPGLLLGLLWLTKSGKMQSLVVAEIPMATNCCLSGNTTAAICWRIYKKPERLNCFLFSAFYSQLDIYSPLDKQSLYLEMFFSWVLTSHFGLLTLCLGGDFGVCKLSTCCSQCLVAGAADMNAPIAFLPIIKSLLELTAVIMRFNRSLTAFNSHGWVVMNMLE